MTSMSFFDDVIANRGRFTPGWNPLAFLEHFFDCKPVLLSNREPDPNTCRDDYYYNTRQNVLYKKITTTAIGCSTQTPKVWKAISER